jgi:hypothetical protein
MKCYLKRDAPKIQSINTTKKMLRTLIFSTIYESRSFDSNHPREYPLVAIHVDVVLPD